MPSHNARNQRVALIAVLFGFLVAGCAGAPGQPTAPTPGVPTAPVGEALPPCPGHWHATFEVYVDGQKVEFLKPPWTLNPDLDAAGRTRTEGLMSVAVHMHIRDRGNVIHFEPSEPKCVGVAPMFLRVGVDLTSHGIRFADMGHGAFDGRGFEANGTQGLHAYLREAIQHYNATRQRTVFEEYAGWREVSMPELLAMDQVRDFAKLLVVFGAPTTTEVDDWESAMPNPPGAA